MRKNKKNPHIGSSFESWLDEEGIRADVTAAAIVMLNDEERGAIVEALKGKRPEPKARRRCRTYTKASP